MIQHIERYQLSEDSISSYRGAKSSKISQNNYGPKVDFEISHHIIFAFFYTFQIFLHL